MRDWHNAEKSLSQKEKEQAEVGLRPTLLAPRYAVEVSRTLQGFSSTVKVP